MQDFLRSQARAHLLRTEAVCVLPALVPALRLPVPSKLRLQPSFLPAARTSPLLLSKFDQFAHPPLQVSEQGKYLKGLCVVDDVAFFGIAPGAPRDRRADPSLNCELAAFDLQQRLLLWRRQLPTHGLLNVGKTRQRDGPPLTMRAARLGVKHSELEPRDEGSWSGRQVEAGRTAS